MIVQHLRIVETRDDNSIGDGFGETRCLDVLIALCVMEANPLKAPGMRTMPTAANFHHQIASGECAG